MAKQDKEKKLKEEIAQLEAEQRQLEKEIQTRAEAARVRKMEAEVRREELKKIEKAKAMPTFILQSIAHRNHHLYGNSVAISGIHVNYTLSFISSGDVTNFMHELTVNGNDLLAAKLHQLLKEVKL